MDEVENIAVDFVIYYGMHYSQYQIICYRTPKILHGTPWRYSVGLAVSWACINCVCSAMCIFRMQI